jgi:hypothetical protein
MDGMRIVRAMFSLLLPALLALGCRAPRTATVQVAPGVPFQLCLPEAGPDFFANQEVRFRFPGGRQETVMAAIENRGGRLNLVASSPMGQTLFVVRMKGAEVAVDTRIPIPGDLDPRVLPALVQFSLWPEEALRPALGQGIRLESDGARRTLLRKGRPVWTVLREGEAPPYRSLLLENPALGMSVQITTLED